MYLVFECFLIVYNGVKILEKEKLICVIFNMFFINEKRDMYEWFDLYVKYDWLLRWLL